MSDQLCMEILSRPEHSLAVRTFTINRSTWWGIWGGFASKTFSSTVAGDFRGASGCAVLITRDSGRANDDGIGHTTSCADGTNQLASSPLSRAIGRGRA